MKLEKLMVIIIAACLSYVAYAENRNVIQDEKIANMDKLIERHAVLMKMQVKYQELLVDKKVISHSIKELKESYKYVTDTSEKPQ